MNPMQMVPAFVVDGATLTQSVSLKKRERERELILRERIIEVGDRLMLI